MPYIVRKCQTHLKVSFPTILEPRMMYFHVCDLIYDLHHFLHNVSKSFLSHVGVMHCSIVTINSVSTHMMYEIV